MTVFLEIWNRPLTTVSGTSFLTEAAAVCHGDSVFAELPGIAPLVELEEVRAADPFVILGVGSASSEQEFRENWQKHRDLRAVKDGRLVFIDSDALQRASLRSPDAIAQLCSELDQVRVRTGMINAADAMPYIPPGAEGGADVAVVRMPPTALERDIVAALSMRYAPADVRKGTAAAPAEAGAATSTPQASAPAPATPPPAPPIAPGAPLQLALDGGALPAATATATAPAAPEPAAAPPGGPVLAAAPPVAPAVSTSVGPGALGNYTQVRRYGDLFFLSGQIALDPASGRFDGGARIEEQTRLAMQNVERVLEAERLTLANVISTTVYLRDINDLSGMNVEYERFFRHGLPSRTIVEATNLPRGARVEITVVAGR
jgi:2-iminobutanoate/2-iminopropanoate deaminase